MLRSRWAKVLVFVLCLAPAFWLGWRGWHEDLSANPIEFITRYTGDWTLRFLVLTLAVTPLRKLLGLPDLIKFRRMIGLYAFFYGFLHFLTYLILDRFAGLDFPDGIVALSTVRNLAASVAADVYKRPFITIGFTAFMLMVPLAVTSTAGMIRRLGGKRWNALHRLVYVSAVAGAVHYYWLVKADVRRPIIYGAVVAVLLGIRFYWSRMRATAPRQASTARRPVKAPTGSLS